MGKLTAMTVRAAKKPGRYHDGQGLMLLVKPSGARSWLVRVQVDGKRRDFGLGSANAISLSEAREGASETRKLFRGGTDPSAAKRASRAVTVAIPSFREAAASAHADHKGGWRNEKHRAQWLSTLKTYAFPVIGDTRVDQVDAGMIQSALLPIWLTKPETARRVRQRIMSVLDWAHGKRFRASEAPTRAVGKLLPRQPKKDGHFVAMDYAAVTTLMSKLAEGESIGRLALRFLILTAARSGEVRAATWEEVDLEKGVWTVPAAKMKAGRVHTVPLSPAALAVLKTAAKGRTGRMEELVFPGLRGKSLSDMTLTKVLRAAGGDKATVHGFRSSFRDWAAERTRVEGAVVEAALAHTNANRVEAAYRRTNYLEKRSALMRKWAAFLAATPRPAETAIEDRAATISEK